MCASFKVQIIQRVGHLENQVYCSGGLVFLNMPESALDTGKPSAYTLIRPSQAPLECLFYLSVKGHQRERTHGLFWVFSSAIIKTQRFLMRGAVLRPCLSSLPPRQEADSFLWKGSISPRQPQWAQWVFPLPWGQPWAASSPRAPMGPCMAAHTAPHTP